MGATPWPMAGPRDQGRHAAPAPPPHGRREASPGGQRAPPNPPPPPPHRPGGGQGGGPPPPPPPPPTAAGEPQARPSAPPGPGGRPPLRGNGGAMRATAAGPAPANPHRRAGATRTTEQEGGRAPHDPPVTTARSEVTEGGCQVRWGPQGGGPRAAPHPPHPGAALQPRPQARAGRERTGDAERARKEYHRPPPGTRAGRPRRDTPPPPPAPPPARQPQGPRPPPPEAEGTDPPAREGSRSVTRPDAPAAGSNGGREEQVGPRLRTGTPRRSCPEKPGGREPEWYGWPRPPWTARRQGTPALLPTRGKRPRNPLTTDR